MTASFISLLVLCGITLTVIFDAIVRIGVATAVDAAGAPKDEEAEVNPYIVCGFAIGGLILDCSTFAAFHFWGKKQQQKDLQRQELDDGVRSTSSANGGGKSEAEAGSDGAGSRIPRCGHV